MKWLRRYLDEPGSDVQELRKGRAEPRGA